MKGVIINCLEKLVKSKFGTEKWEAVLEGASIERNATFLVQTDVPEETALSILDSLCKTLNLSSTQAADAFGDYWVNDYAPKIYRAFYREADDARSFLLRMDDIHAQTTKSIPNAQPPRFSYEWEDNCTLVIGYKSHRGLVDILMGLIRGVGRYFSENLEVRKINDSTVRVKFLGA